MNIPEGWKLVPVYPSVEMHNAGRKACGSGDMGHHVYEVMLAAAPLPPQADVGPVAWLVDTGRGRSAYVNNPDHWAHGYTVQPLYTHPDSGELSRLRTENEELRAKLEIEQKDAERWRFFSQVANDLQAFPHAWGKMTPEKMNHMCDEAMATSPATINKQGEGK